MKWFVCYNPPTEHTHWKKTSTEYARLLLWVLFSIIRWGKSMQKIPESLRRVNSILNADKTPDTANINSINNISGNSNPPLKVYKIHFNNVLPNNVSDMAVREMSGGSVCLEKNREYSRDLVHESFMTHGNGNAEKEYQSLVHIKISFII